LHACMTAHLRIPWVMSLGRDGLEARRKAANVAQSGTVGVQTGSL